MTIFVRVLAVLILALLPLRTVHAADKPLHGPVPVWVKPMPATVPVADSLAASAAVRLLNVDQQIRFDPATGLNDFVHTQFKVQSPQGLTAMGTLTYSWKPDTDTLVVHNIHILRGTQVIDVFAGGREFTILRRENNLEYAALNGVLTATIQPEGLQVGDILDVAYTLTRKDPVLQGHSELSVGGWPEMTVDAARIIAVWPQAQPVRTRATDLPAPLVANSGGVSMIATQVPVLVRPQGAPRRYLQGRVLEISDFASWGEVSALLAPLYDTARKLGPASQLTAEIAKLKAVSPDPKLQAGAALALVQDQVRYVFLGMNQGSMVPATPDETWQRRFGDCKGKTVLLLALLDGLGIAAEPAVVSTSNGDGLESRLPMVAAFDHVLVRATIAGKVYWLDGTRVGDRAIDTLRVPSFVWSLPLRSAGAALEPLLVPPLSTPDSIMSLRLDASAGIDKPAPAHAEAIFGGDSATLFKLQLANLAPADLDRGLREFWRKQYDFITATSVSTGFDPATGTEHLVMDGTATMDWGVEAPSRYELDGVGLGWKGDYHRDPGPNHEAPFAIGFPAYSRTTETIILPGKGAGFALSGGLDVNTEIAKREFRRTAKISDGVMTTETSTRSLASEFPFADAAAADKTLRAMSEVGTYLYAPAKPAEIKYRPQTLNVAPIGADSADDYLKRAEVLRAGKDDVAAGAEVDGALKRFPESANVYAYRAMLTMNGGKPKEALADSEQALALDPDNRAAAVIHAILLSRDPARANLAIAETTRALAIFPDNLDLLLARAKAYYAARKFHPALADSARVIALNPALMETYLLRANIFRSAGNNAEVRAVAHAVMTANPNNAEAFVYAGVILARLDARAESDAAFTRSIAIKPSALAYLNRAQQRPTSDIAGRNADIAAALKLEPDMIAALNEQARIEIDSKDYAAAVATLKKLLARGKEESGTHLTLAIALAKMGDFAAAETALAKASAAAAGDAVQLNRLCFGAAIANVLLEPALAACRASLALSNGDANALDSLGFVLLRLNRYAEAISAYNSALEALPNLPEPRYGRGLAQLRLGQSAAGNADLKAALANAPMLAARFKGYGLAP